MSEGLIGQARSSRARGVQDDSKRYRKTLLVENAGEIAQFNGWFVEITKRIEPRVQKPCTIELQSSIYGYVPSFIFQRLHDLFYR